MLRVAKGVGSDSGLLLSPFVLLGGELAKRDDQMAGEGASGPLEVGGRRFEARKQRKTRRPVFAETKTLCE